MQNKRDEEDGQVFVWQGYQGNIELHSFKTFLTCPVRRVALGGGHSLILTYNDQLFALGNNNHGQLGCPKFTREHAFDPCLVEAGQGIAEIACGTNHSACVKKDGNIFLWGDNQFGQCGLNPSGNNVITSPTLLELSYPEEVMRGSVTSIERPSEFVRITCGTQHNLALSVDGNVWVWGKGPQLGLRDDVLNWRPTILKQFCDRHVISICSGDFHNIVIVEEGVIDRFTAPITPKTPLNVIVDKTNSAKGSPNAERSYMKSSPNSNRSINTKGSLKFDKSRNVERSSDKDKDSSDTTNKSEFPEASKTNTLVKPLTEKQEKKAIIKETIKSVNEIQVVVEQADSVTNDKKADQSNTSENEKLVADRNTEIDTKTIETVDLNQDTDEAMLGTTAKEKLDGHDGNSLAKADESWFSEKSDKGDKTKPEGLENDSEGTGKSEVNDKTNSHEVEMRKKSSESSDKDFLTASIRSDTSVSSKVSRSKSFLDETGAREFLARQFEDDDDIMPLDKPARVLTEKPSSNVNPSSPGAYMLQTVSSLTNQVTSMTSKALSNIASVPGKFRFPTSGLNDDEGKSSSENLAISEVSDLDMGSSENINLDNSTLEFSNLTISDTSINTSQLSLPESEKSETSFGSTGSLESGPSTPKKNQSNRKSVSKESQSIRTIEAKQANLRKRSLSLLTSEEDENEYLYKTIYSLDTEIWCWGRNSKGQLGLGDMLDRKEPTCIQIMTGKRIVKVACGSFHSMAISSTGEVYSWGLNESGQLGHKGMASCPAKLELPSDCCVWDVDAGSNHSIYLLDNVAIPDTRPEIYYAGKHPCKDLYVPIFKTSRLTHLKVLRKAGWINSVITGGDNCACVSRSENQMTLTFYQLTRGLQDINKHLHNITQELVKRIQISGYFKSLDVQPYKKMLETILRKFCHLSQQFGKAYSEVRETFTRGDNLMSCSLFLHYEDYVGELKKYSAAYEDMVAAGGFEFAAKNASSLFESFKEIYTSLLPGTKSEDKPDHANKFRDILFIPVDKVSALSKIIGKLAELYDKSSRENNLLTSVHLNFEHFLRTSKSAITDADNTKKFWDTSASKISESLRSPARRLIKESKTSPLTLLHASRFSTNTFYLFNDIFIHSQYSSYNSYPLETVWIDTPSSDSSSHQHVFTVTTPEDLLSLSAQSAQLKVEWVIAFNTAINKVLSSQKFVNRQNSSDRVHTPVIRLSTHTFTKHLLYKDATYNGYWLNGKIHGSGLLKWSDGRRYKGKFQQGSITGSGKMLIPKENKTEEIQEGTWKDAKLHGHGKIKYGNGDLYDGYFKHGLRHGHGVYRRGRHLNSASFLYVGEWLYDKKHGYGVIDNLLNGEKYMGMWQEDNRHGDGIVVTLDGMYFEGNFQNNKLVGHGLMLTDDNSCYEGEFSGITMLQGKGCLMFPNGDKIEGTFNGTWNQGLKITGTFHKTMAPVIVKHSWSKTTLETKSSLYSRLCVRPERKWEEIFYQCYDSLGYSGDGEPNMAKAWDQVVTAIVAGKHRLKDREKGVATSSKQHYELAILEQLEKIPAHCEGLTLEHYHDITLYLNKATETVCHPLGKLIDDLVDVFRAAYIGIGAHPRLLHHAINEIKSYIKRIYKVIRILFPELPYDGSPTHIYPGKAQKLHTPITENKGILQHQVSETEDELTAEIVSSTGLLQPILMPKVYPALFDLYALYCDKDDEKYWERVQKLNKQGDMSLMAYLGIDQSFWCIDESLFKDRKTRISAIKDHSYSSAVEVLQQISTAFGPCDKLEVIQKTFLTITQTVEEYMKGEHMWCMDDLFPIFQFVVIRACIHHLGAEINYIEDLMESYLEFGELGIMFTTLKVRQ